MIFPILAGEGDKNLLLAHSTVAKCCRYSESAGWAGVIWHPALVIYHPARSPHHRPLAQPPTFEQRAARSHSLVELAYRDDR